MMFHRVYLLFFLIGLAYCHARGAAADRVGPGPGKVPVPGQPPGAYQAYQAYQGGTQDASSVTKYFHALGWLKTYAAKLEKSHANRLPEARQPLQQIQTDAAFLQQAWQTWPQRHPGQNPNYGPAEFDSYFKAIQGSQRQLKELQKASDGEILSAVKAVADDLHAKAENCRYSADGLGKNIDVTVRTKKGTAEVAGYQVYCVPKALVKFEKEHIRFPKMSSPTIYRNFSPGHYLMWLQKEKEKTEPIAQTIGGHGEKELEIDLPVPTESSVPK